jgi:hypothetical protein
MRFEPRLFREDDEPSRQPEDEAAASGFAPVTDPTFGATAGEFSNDLPDELATLGAQLSDAADRLTLSYPSRRHFEATAAGDPALRDKSRWLRWAGAAAAVLLAVGTWRLVDDRASTDDSPVPHGISAAPAKGASASGPLAVVERSIGGAKSAADESGLPASIFRGLTGAEQEAVLDLMQDNAQQHGQLTI